MKRTILLFAVFAGLCSTSAFAQYKVTEKDLGNDCMTESGKLGTYKQVTITESVSNGSSSGSTSTRSSNTSVGASVGANAGFSKGGASVGASVGASASYGNSNSNSSSNTSTQTTTTTRSYQDIQCVEDKNANAPQMSPVRW